MMRLLAVAVIALIANAIALIVGDLILDKMSVSAASFVIAVLIFTGAGLKYDPPPLGSPIDLAGSEEEILAQVRRAVGA